MWGVKEVMGGIGLAKSLCLKALQAGKSVVTANKALIADSLEELQQASISNNAVFAYEAAVCGGIPIIQVMQTCYAGDVIHQVMVCEH